ncbi:hypothetical protein [Enterovirga rhinocerotis]|uniref:Uncharacterized protein n=1 Tax=Enterovirga rhinocerotis TaxID=1339210 RepID=A0A4R7BZE3_9HYPH|nr:hypothetical protein [Enterovirga rhinocerotis]TDR90135.1 hypothetical protein EV668_2977 [Enterovirga rhinocerotis]
MRSMLVVAVAALCLLGAPPATAVPSAKAVSASDLVSEARVRQRRVVCRDGHVRRWVRGRWRVTPFRRCR